MGFGATLQWHLALEVDRFLGLTFLGLLLGLGLGVYRACRGLAHMRSKLSMVSQVQDPVRGCSAWCNTSHFQVGLMLIDASITLEAEVQLQRLQTCCFACALPHRSCSQGSDNSSFLLPMSMSGPVCTVRANAVHIHWKVLLCVQQPGQKQSGNSADRHVYKSYSNRKLHSLHVSVSW